MIGIEDGEEAEEKEEDAPMAVEDSGANRLENSPFLILNQAALMFIYENTPHMT